MNINKNHTPRNQTWNQYLSKLRRIQFLLNNNRTKDRRTDSHEPFTSKIVKLVGECFSSTRVPTCGHRWCGPTYGSTYGRELPEVGRVCFSLSAVARRCDLAFCSQSWEKLVVGVRIGPSSDQYAAYPRLVDACAVRRPDPGERASERARTTRRTRELRQPAHSTRPTRVSSSSSSSSVVRPPSVPTRVPTPPSLLM